MTNKQVKAIAKILKKIDKSTKRLANIHGRESDWAIEFRNRIYFAAEYDNNNSEVWSSGDQLLVPSSNQDIARAILSLHSLYETQIIDR